MDPLPAGVRTPHVPGALPIRIPFFSSDIGAGRPGAGYHDILILRYLNPLDDKGAWPRVGWGARGGGPCTFLVKQQ